MESFLRLSDVRMTVDKGHGQQKTVLDGVSLGIASGERTFVWGPNGAGKTSLFQAIAVGSSAETNGDGASVVAKRVTGSIVLDGVELTDLPPHKRARWISRISQNPLDMFSEALTLEENFAAMCRPAGWRSPFRRGVSRGFRQELRDRIAGIDERLAQRTRENVSVFSGGELQLLAFLAATYIRPKLLLLDEHTRALDSANRERVERLTQDFVKDHSITTIWISHDPEQVAEYATRVILLAEGRMVGELPQDILRGRDAGKVEEHLVHFLHTFRPEGARR